MVVRQFLAVVAVIFSLAGCGSGGVAGVDSQAVGVAAFSGPMSGAVVTVTDALARTVSTTTDATGSFVLPMSGLTAPYVLRATMMMGEAEANLISVIAHAPSANQTVRVNINPLTHAVAARLASNSIALSLAENISTERVNITADAVAAGVNYLNQAFAGLATSAGVATNFNPFTDVYTANGTGLDKLVLNLSMQNLPGTGVRLFVRDAATTDDMAGTTTMPTPMTPVASTSTVTLGRGTNLAAVPALTAFTVRDFTIAQGVPALMNACFAIPPGSRSSATTCTTGLAAPDYLNNAKTLTQELATYQATEYTGSTFTTQVERYYTNTRALVKVMGKRPDGAGFSFKTVLTKVTVSGGTSTESATGSWMLKGNQRSVSLSMLVRARRQIQLNTNYPIPSAYFTGLSFYIDPLTSPAFSLHGGDASAPGASCTGSACSYVRVSGPGMTTSVLLKRNAQVPGCDFGLALVQSVSSSPQGCSGGYQVNGVTMDAARSQALANQFDPIVRPSYSALNNAAISNYATTGWITQDAVIAQMSPQSPYVFEVYDGIAQQTKYYVDRLAGRLLTTAEVAASHWLDLSQNSINQLYPPSLSSSGFPGGDAFTFQWQRPPGAYPVSTVFIWFNNNNTAQQVWGRIMFSGSPSLGVQSFTAHSPSGVTYPALGTSNSGNMIQLIGDGVDGDTPTVSTWGYGN